MVHHRAVIVHALHSGIHHRHQVRSVAVHVHVSHTQRSHVRTLSVYCFPVQPRAVLEYESRHVPVALHLQPFRCQFRQIFQSQRRQRAWQPQIRQRSALRHRHTLHRRTSRVQFLQQRLAPEVQHRRVLAVAPRIRLPLQAHLPQLTAAARHEPPRRLRSLLSVRHAQVKFSQRRAVAQFQAVQQVARCAPHVQFHHSRRTEQQHRVVQRPLAGHVQRALLAAQQPSRLALHVVLAAQAIGKVVFVTRRDLYHVRLVARFPRQVEARRVSAICAHAIPRVKQRKAVRYEVLQLHPSRAA